MGCFAMEVELYGIHAGVACAPCTAVSVRMPGQRAVNAIECAVPNHENLANQQFFCRAAIEANRTLNLTGNNRIFEHDCCADRADAEVVVPAAVTRTLWLIRILELFMAADGLVQAWQRVILAEIRNHRMSLAIFCAYGRRHGANTELNAEPLFFKELCNRSGRFLFLEAGLCILPDFL